MLLLFSSYLISLGKYIKYLTDENDSFTENMKRIKDLL